MRPSRAASANLPTPASDSQPANPNLTATSSPLGGAVTAQPNVQQQQGQVSAQQRVQEQADAAAQLAQVSYDDGLGLLALSLAFAGAGKQEVSQLSLSMFLVFPIQTLIGASKDRMVLEGSKGIDMSGAREAR